MSEGNWFGLGIIIVVLGVVFGGIKQCDFDNQVALKCIEKTGDKFCGALKK